MPNDQDPMLPQIAGQLHRAGEILRTREAELAQAGAQHEHRIGSIRLGAAAALLYEEESHAADTAERARLETLRTRAQAWPPATPNVTQVAQVVDAGEPEPIPEATPAPVQADQPVEQPAPEPQQEPPSLKQRLRTLGARLTERERPTPS